MKEDRVNKRGRRAPPRSTPGISWRAGSWRIHFYAPDSSGRRVRQFVTFAGTLTEAKHERARLIHEVRTGQRLAAADVSVQEYLSRWLDERSSRLAGTTLARYRALVKVQVGPNIGGERLDRLTATTLKNFYLTLAERGGADGGPLSSTTVAQAHRLLHAALRSALREGLIPISPADRLDPPRPRRVEVEALDLEGLQRLIEGVRSEPSLRRFLIPVLLAGVCGLRRGEVLALRWGDVNLDAGELIVARSLESVHVPSATRGDDEAAFRLAFKSPKSGKKRRVALPAFVVEELRRHRVEQAKMRLLVGPGYRDGELVVATADGSPWPPASFSPRFVAAVRRLGFPGLHFHVLRHTAVTIRLGLGEHPKLTSELAGHHSTAFTLDRYGHALPSMQREAAAKVDEAFRRSTG